MRYQLPTDPSVAEKFVGRVVFTAHTSVVGTHKVVALATPKHPRWNHLRNLVSETGQLNGEFFDDEQEACLAALSQAQSDVRFAQGEIADIQARLNGSLKNEAQLRERLEKMGLCPKCFRNMEKGEPHTADCESALAQDAL